MSHVDAIETVAPFVDLYALINNAGVMILGEFHWQTEQQVKHQVAVNLTGTMRVTQVLMSVVLSNKSRIVVISSHCAEEFLPGLSVYGATKAALRAWSISLRVELAKHGVKVISFVPGRCITRIVAPTGTEGAFLETQTPNAL